jgi:hypothetical protein
LLELDKLVKEFGKPLPFPLQDFKTTISQCETRLKPYREDLKDQRMGLSKKIWKIKFLGKDRELEDMREQITGHYQALNLCISFLQL